MGLLFLFEIMQFNYPGQFQGETEIYSDLKKKKKKTDIRGTVGQFTNLYHLLASPDVKCVVRLVNFKIIKWRDLLRPHCHYPQFKQAHDAHPRLRPHQTTWENPMSLPFTNKLCFKVLSFAFTLPSPFRPVIDFSNIAPAHWARGFMPDAMRPFKFLDLSSWLLLPSLYISLVISS